MRKKTFFEIVKLQTEQTERHLDEVRSIYKEMRGYKHDFHHHLQTLRTQIEFGEYDRALRYIEELDTDLMEVDILLKTGNIALDAILSGKISHAKSLGITIAVKATVPDKLTLTDAELSIIVGNLLDNAIEACKKVTEKPYIDIYIGMKGKMLYFHMMNSAGSKQKKSGSLFSTQKSGLHGFGLHRVESIIEEHCGWCKYNSEDGAFTSEFLVPAVG